MGFVFGMTRQLGGYHSRYFGRRVAAGIGRDTRKYGRFSTQNKSVSLVMNETFEHDLNVPFTSIDSTKPRRWRSWQSM